MACGCTSAKQEETTTLAFKSSETTTDNGCPYSKELCASWLVKVECIKSNGYYINIPNTTVLKLNLYIGILLSVENYKGSPCYFQAELEEIESFITVITSMNLC